MSYCLDKWLDIHILKPKCIIDLAPNNPICFHNFLNFVINKEVERVDMLLDETLNL
jgi:hypothetical protein